MLNLPNETFLDALKQEEFVSRLSLCENISLTSDSEGINLAAEQFAKIINDDCLRSPRLAQTKKDFQET